MIFLNKIKSTISTRSILLIAYPIIIGNLAQTLITFVDTAFLGHLGIVELGASMMAGIYYYVFSTLAWGFAVGVQIIVARRFGEANLHKIGAVFDHGLFIVLFLSLFLFSLLHFFTDYLLSMVIESDNILLNATEYMKYRHYGIIFVCFNFLFRSLYIGLSNTKIITYTTLLMAVVNILLDYLLIFGKCGFPALGVGGAAIASVCAEVSALLFFIFYSLKVLPIKTYNMFLFNKLDMSLMKSMIHLSLPTMLQRLLSFGIWFVFFIMIEGMGEMPIAISGVVRSVYALILVPVFAFGATVNTLTSRLIGEGKSSEVHAMILKVFVLSIIIITPLVLLCIIMPETLASIYTEDATLAAMSVPVLYVVSIGAFIMCFGTSFFEAVSGTGNTRAALILETIVIIIYVFYIFLVTIIFKKPIEIVWCAEWVYALFIGIFAILYLRFSSWQNKKI